MATFKEMIALVVFFSLLSKNLAQVTIPTRYDGFTYTTKNQIVGQGRVEWEAFIDPMCPYSKASWPIVKQVKEHYNSSSLHLNVHPFSVPFHHNSFFTSRALHIAQAANTSLVYPLLELIFDNQESFSTSGTNNETPASVKSRLASLAGSLGMSENEFAAGFNSTDTNRAARTSFKYGCTRGVVQTPSFLVNGFMVIGADAGWNATNWTNLFDPIIS